MTTTTTTTFDVSAACFRVPPSCSPRFSPRFKIIYPFFHTHKDVIFLSFFSSPFLKLESGVTGFQLWTPWILTGDGLAWTFHPSFQTSGKGEQSVDLRKTSFFVFVCFVFLLEWVEKGVESLVLEEKDEHNIKQNRIIFIFGC